MSISERIEGENIGECIRVLADEIDSLRAAMDERDERDEKIVRLQAFANSLDRQLATAQRRINDQDQQSIRLQEQVTRLQLKAAGIANGQELADAHTGA